MWPFWFHIFCGVTAKKLRQSWPVLAESITHAFNNCLGAKKFPSTWKAARLVIKKSPDKDPSEAKSYRPISLLLVLSKALEYVIVERIRRAHVEKTVRIHKEPLDDRRNPTRTQLVEGEDRKTRPRNLSGYLGRVRLSLVATTGKWHEGHRLRRRPHRPHKKLPRRSPVGNENWRPSHTKNPRQRVPARQRLWPWPLEIRRKSTSVRDAAYNNT